MKEALKEARRLAENGDLEQAKAILRMNLAPHADFALICRAAKWAKSIDSSNQKILKVAFLGGGTIEQLVDFVHFWLMLEGIKLVPYVAPFDTWPMDVLKSDSPLYQFQPDIVWLFLHHRDLKLPNSAVVSADDAPQIVAGVLENLSSYWQRLQSQLPNTQIIQNTIPSLAERPLGNLELVLPGSRLSLLREINSTLIKNAENYAIKLFDLEHLANSYGLLAWHNAAYWLHSKHPFSPEFSSSIAYYMAKMLNSSILSSKKVIVLDLDNTLWGGVIGDDGLEGIKLGNGADGEAFVKFQMYLKKLAERGIVLTVVSKNEEAAATIPFKEHPFMVLMLEDIAVFKANWTNKADNIREIAKVLNLGLDSFVFLDDNPAERALVRSELPMVTTPTLPEDPSEYTAFLDSLSLFETQFLSSEDSKRNKMYRENAQRAEAFQAETNIDDYLCGLEMFASSGKPVSFTIPRMSQLINKSNQFHPTTTRYTESEIKDFSDDPTKIVRWFSLKDRFGDHGLISSLILRHEGDTFTIDTWSMSCRVLERGMEEFILRAMIDIADEKEVKQIIGVYKPTNKNALVKNLYGRLGFEKIDENDEGTVIWQLLLPSCRENIPLFISALDQA